MLMFMHMPLQSRFCPLPKGLHIAFCIFATVLFIAAYLRSKNLKDLLWLFVCDVTFVLQIYGDKYTAAAVAVCEIVLLAMIFVLYRKEKKAAKKDGSEEKKDNELRDIEKCVKAERSKIMGKEKQDVISEAFDSDDIS